MLVAASQVVAMKKAKGEGTVATGEFGAMMEVALTNDGPVTITVDSPTGLQRKGGKKGNGLKVAKGTSQGAKGGLEETTSDGKSAATRESVAQAAAALAEEK